jgi:hypothetical protein
MLVKKSGRRRSGKAQASLYEEVKIVGKVSGRGQKKKHRKQRGRRRAARPLSAYRAALSDPFSEEAIGARITDPYAVPTVTARFSTRAIIQSTSSGVASFAILPTLWNSLQEFGGTVVGAGLNQNSTSTDQYGILPPASYAAILGNLFTCYRVVAVGVEIRQIMTATSATGLLAAVPIPLIGPIPGPNEAGTVVVDPTIMWQNLAGVQLGTFSLPSQLINSWPGSEEYNVQEIMTKAISYTLRPCSVDAFDWINASNVDKFNATQYFGAGGMFTSAAVLTSADHITTNLAARGWNGLMVHGYNFPNSTNALEVRLVYHLEGFPQLSSSTSGGTEALRPHFGPSLTVEESLLGTLRDSVIRLGRDALSSLSLRDVVSGLASLTGYHGRASGRVPYALGDEL